MIIRPLQEADIPAWVALSREYDQYILKLVPDLGVWYGGDDTSPPHVDKVNMLSSKTEVFDEKEETPFSTVRLRLTAVENATMPKYPVTRVFCPPAHRTRRRRAIKLKEAEASFKHPPRGRKTTKCGDDTSLSFTAYMQAKIASNEAHIAIDDAGGCVGVVAYSVKNNRITFFGVSHSADYDATGSALIELALSKLNLDKEVSINTGKGEAPILLAENRLAERYGFRYNEDILENGVPVRHMVREK